LVRLNENGVIEAYDAAGNPTKNCAPDDPYWKVQATIFDPAPRESPRWLV
jgi:hypothetical protein